MKCFDEDPMRPHYVSFNYSVIRTRRVVEQAFGRLKKGTLESNCTEQAK